MAQAQCPEVASPNTGGDLHPVPSGLDPAGAAPMMCGGITVFSPLEHWGAGTKAKDVGIVGIGGLGHFAVLFAKAMGARVTAISRSESKKEDALKLGASEYVATGDDIKKTAEAHAGTLDLIVCTASKFFWFFFFFSFSFWWLGGEGNSQYLFPFSFHAKLTSSALVDLFRP